MTSLEFGFEIATDWKGVRMSAGGELNEKSSSPLPDCSQCGDPVLFAVVTRPDSGTVEPCGCSIPPKLFDQIGEE